MLDADIVKSCPDESNGIGSAFGIAFWIAIALFLVYLAIQRWRLGRRGIYVDPNHPLVVEAVRKAQESTDTLRRLHESHGEEVAVKFRLKAQDGSSELPWGRLLVLSASDFTAEITTPLLFVEMPASGRVTLPLEQLVDWHLTLPDGKIRGSFTTQAEIRISQQAGKRLPAQIAQMQGRFLDG